MTNEVNDTSTTTVATDPVQGNVAPQELPTNDPINENKGIEAQLAEFLASQTKVEPEAPTGDSTTERPTGGVNDLTADDVGDDPNAKRLITLLDTHYPTLDRERIVGRALEYGDPDLIDVNYLRDQMGDLADTFLGFFEDLVTERASSYDELVEEVYEFVGGKEQWDLVAKTFRSKAPAHIINTVRSLVDSTNRDEVEQGLKFIYDYSIQTGLVDKTPKRVATGGGGAGGDGLSAEQFSKALKELGHRNKDPKTYDATVASLRQRRATGISLGL